MGEAPKRWKGERVPIDEGVLVGHGPRAFCRDGIRCDHLHCFTVFL